MENKDKISCCNICLLADAMKSCPSCTFNPSKLKLTQAELDTVSRVELLKVGTK